MLVAELSINGTPFVARAWAVEPSDAGDHGEYLVPGTLAEPDKLYALRNALELYYPFARMPICFEGVSREYVVAIVPAQQPDIGALAPVVRMR